MQEAMPAVDSGVAKNDWLRLVHRMTGFAAVPFLLTSILLAVGLTHTDLLNALSAMVYETKPIPQIALGEAVVPGSWDQALKLAKLATGKDGHVITSRGGNIIVVQAFENHSHDPAVAKQNPHEQLLIDTRTMTLVRIEDKTTSLVSMGHAIHAYRFLGVEGLSLSTASSTALLTLLLTGAMLAWRDRRAGAKYGPASSWHVRLGRAMALFLVVIALTTLDFEYSLFGRGDPTASLAIPAVQLSEPIRPGSIDQARLLAQRAIGAAPRAVFIRGNADLKFSEAGDGIGGKSVWADGNSMTIKRITDWRNDRQAFSFILHDGRWLGGMNALNINDVVALGLLALLVNGVVISLRGRFRRI